MIITKEIERLDQFEPWSGGRDTMNDLTAEQMDELMPHIEELFPDGCTETELNDYLWFERDDIYSFLGIDEDGNKIGSDEWATKVLIKEIESNSYDPVVYDVNKLVDEWIGNEYLNDAKSPEDLYDDFVGWVYDKYIEDAKDVVPKKFGEQFSEEDIQTIIEDNIDYDSPIGWSEMLEYFENEEEVIIDEEDIPAKD